MRTPIHPYCPQLTLEENLIDGPAVLDPERNQPLMETNMLQDLLTHSPSDAIQLLPGLHLALFEAPVPAGADLTLLEQKILYALQLRGRARCGEPVSPVLQSRYNRAMQMLPATQTAQLLIAAKQANQAVRQGKDRFGEADTSGAPRQKRVGGGYAGKMLRMTGKPNPHREGTKSHGWFQLLRDGMTVEEYLTAGGFTHYIKFAIEHALIKLEEVK